MGTPTTAVLPSSPHLALLGPHPGLHHSVDILNHILAPRQSLVRALEQLFDIRILDRKLLPRLWFEDHEDLGLAQEKLLDVDVLVLEFVEVRDHVDDILCDTVENGSVDVCVAAIEDRRGAVGDVEPKENKKGPKEMVSIRCFPPSPLGSRSLCASPPNCAAHDWVGYANRYIISSNQR